MTYLKLKHTVLTGIAALGLSVMLPATSAMAADATDGLVVKTTSDGTIRLGVRAYIKGDYDKAISLTRAALKSSLSNKKAAVAHSNLCAAYAKIGAFENAQSSCDAALDLRPAYAPAQSNKAALTLKLAEK